MTKPGRRPKPTALRVIDGDRPGRVNEDEPSPPRSTRCPRSPAWLADDARKIWRRYAPELHARGVLTEWDADSLGVACSELARYQRALSYLEAGLLLPDDGGGLKVNPATRLARDGSASVRAWAKRHRVREVGGRDRARRYTGSGS